MLNLSKYFKQDIADPNQTLKPVVFIRKTGMETVRVATEEHQLRIYSDMQGHRNMHIPIPCLEKISNIKISNDYDSKKIKINRLRCTLYNYYDVSTKLSNKIDSSFIGADIKVYYKSPTTDTLNLQDEIPSIVGESDYAMLLVFKGEISRVNHNDKTITITAEDSTQIKITDKIVPYMTADKLSDGIRENLLSNYKDENNVVPMTFGRVKKAPTLPYIAENSDSQLEVLFDSHPTSGNFKTAKIPSLFETSPIGAFNYYLYILQGTDYVVYNHINKTSNYQNEKNSRVKLISGLEESYNYIVPEIQQSVDIKNDIWTAQGFHQRMVETVYASDSGNIWDLEEGSIEEIENTDMINIESLNDNGGYPKKWFDEIDIWQSNNESFDTSLRYSNDYNYGSGRWIVLKLDNGIDAPLWTLPNGNTFMCEDSTSYQSLDGSTGYGDYGAFWCVPLDAELWNIARLLTADVNYESDALSQRVANIMTTTSSQQLEWYRNAINEILTEDGYIDDDDLASFNYHGIAPTKAYKATLYGPTEDVAYVSRNNYWGSRNNDNGINGVVDLATNYEDGFDHSYHTRCNGLYYGQYAESDARYVDEVESNIHKTMAIYEFNIPYNYNLGLKLNNIAFLHSVKIENILEEKLYASIEGRKNHFFTEQLDQNLEIYEDSVEIPEMPLENYILGPDGLLVTESYSGEEELPHFVIEQLIESTVINYMWDYINQEDWYFGRLVITDTLEWNNFLNTEIWDSYLSSAFGSAYYADDSVVYRNYEFFKKYIFKSLIIYAQFCITMRAISTSVMFSGRFLRSFLRNIYSYIYQYDYNAHAPTGQDNYFRFRLGDLDNDNVIDYANLKDDFVSLHTHTWDSFEINTFDDYINNFYVFMDDMLSSLMKATLMQSDVIDVTELTEVNIENYDDISWGEWEAYYPIMHNPLSRLEGTYNDINAIRNLLNTQCAYQFNDEIEVDADFGQITDGVIRKPSDVVMNILTSEMGYAIWDIDNNTIGENILKPDYDKFDLQSIELSREAHNEWTMGFSLDKKADGKKLIEDILKESKSYPRFTNDGKFGLITIKNSYTKDDIDTYIDPTDIVNYKFSQTKREQVTTSVKMFYDYDYGANKHNAYFIKSINDLLPEYSITGNDYYNINDLDGHKEIHLKYHSNDHTVNLYTDYYLLNNCNSHNIIDITLPLNYLDIQVGDLIHIPLINNEKANSIDYGVVSYLNSQPIYPIWIVLETNISMRQNKIKAYQLHYLGTDGDHGYEE